MTAAIIDTNPVLHMVVTYDSVIIKYGSKQVLKFTRTEQGASGWEANGLNWATLNSNLIEDYIREAGIDMDAFYEEYEAEQAALVAKAEAHKERLRRGGKRVSNNVLTPATRPQESKPTEEPTFRVKKLSENAVLPEFKNPKDSGMDVSVPLDAPVFYLNPGERRLVPLDISVALEPNTELQVRSRSGLTLKKGLIVLNSPGTVDEGYRGNIGVILHNAGDDRQKVSPGDRIAQIVIAPVIRPKVVAVDELPDDTQRGSGGFGSTGVSR